MPYLRQTNFSGGELGPRLWGRTDLEVFARGARKLRNFFVSHEGALMSRPGMKLIRYAGPTGAAVAVRRVRLVPFAYSDTQSYVLELEPLSLRVWSVQGNALVAQLGTLYTADELDELQWAQSGDVLTVVVGKGVHPLGLGPWELKRLSHTSWTFTQLSFDRPALTAAPRLSNLAANNNGEDSTHVAREWQHAVTEIRRDARGVVYESKPTIITLQADGTAIPSRIARYPDKPVTVEMNSTYADLATDPNFIAYRVYAGRGGAFGWIGDTKATTFTDVGQEPDHAHAPPQGLNPFKVYDSKNVRLRTESPKALTYFQSRLFLGGTDERPAWLWGSATEDYANFDKRLVVTADMALSFDLASRRREEVRSMVGLRRSLVVLTDAAVWVGGGAGGDPLLPDSVDFGVVDEVGTNKIPVPLVVDNSVLFTRTKGTGARALQYDDDRGGFNTVDLTAAAYHFFLGLKAHQYAWATHAISDWAYAEDPFGVVWAVRKDGKLLSLTYTAEGMAAWALHETDGAVLSVCTVPDGEEDAVFLAVVRTVPNGQATTVERLMPRVDSGSVRDNICLDFCGEWTIAPGLEVTGPDNQGQDMARFNGRSDVWAVVRSTAGLFAVYGPLSVAGGKLTLPEAPAANAPETGNIILFAGLKHVPELETLDMAQRDARMREKTVVAVGFEVDQSVGLELGQDVGHLVDWRQRDVSDSYDPISAATAFAKVAVSGTWDQAARAVLRQSAPLPVTVLAVVREIDVGG